ncbi:hypothetical protein L861_06455 [Litchfieldella anticariensis FP35 = DSM 16096]|uniref:Uncharacterized protein n=1 Tax=Litchfieldella anticariensis (strain DSM 16096 / CECT 5854 / CIP 108499 / LMG 22089 / FP35) TaxID=1121939 RepID=S2KF86_LITA3|nr:hypothetical protein L861_06455 [Halomonas anticariensis FP35 = DSM 16096]
MPSAMTVMVLGEEGSREEDEFDRGGYKPRFLALTFSAVID